MKPENQIFLRYTMFVFIAAVIGYTLFYIFGLMYYRPMGFFSGAYLYGFMLHLPVWAAALTFANLILKIKIHRKVTLLLEVLLFALILAPVTSNEVLAYYDYLELPFYAIDFFLCLSLLSLFKRKFVDHKLSTP